MVIKTVNNSNPGTADIVGGDDWDQVSAFINNFNYYGSYSYFVYKSGSTYYAKNGATGAILSTNADFVIVAQAAIAAIITAGFGKLIIGEGVHTVNTPGINIAGLNNCIIQGMGKDATILRAGTAPSIMFKGTLTAAVNISLRDITLDANLTRQVCNFSDNINGLLLENCRFIRGGDAANINAYLGALTNSIIRGCEFSGAVVAPDLCAFSGTNILFEGNLFSRAITGESLTSGGGTNVRIVNNNFVDCVTGGNCLSLEDYNDYNNILIANNTFKNVENGNSIAGVRGSGGNGAFNNITVANNLLNNSGPISFIDTVGLNIVNNTLLRAQSHGVFSIAAQAAIKDVIIRGNILIDKHAGTSPVCAIGLLEGAVNPSSVIIDGNVIDTYEQHGIFARNSKLLTITNNQLRDCGGLTNNTYSGIYLGNFGIQNDKAIISGNIMTSSLANKLKYGVFCDDSGFITSNMRIEDNYISDFATSAIYYNQSGTGMAVKRNSNFLTENSGTATVTSAATSVTVNHGLAITPTINDISVTPTNNLGSSTKYWVSGVTSTQFVINATPAPGATTATFVWAIM